MRCLRIYLVRSGIEREEAGCGIYSNHGYDHYWSTGHTQDAHLRYVKKYLRACSCDECLRAGVNLARSLPGAYVHQPHEMFNGFPLYRKLHNPGHWLLMTARKYWMVSTTYNKNNNGASGFCHAAGSKQMAALPSQVERCIRGSSYWCSVVFVQYRF